MSRLINKFQIETQMWRVNKNNKKNKPKTTTKTIKITMDTCDNSGVQILYHFRQLCGTMGLLCPSSDPLGQADRQTDLETDRHCRANFTRVSSYPRRRRRRRRRQSTAFNVHTTTTTTPATGLASK